jgi:hypothetical protein
MVLASLFLTSSCAGTELARFMRNRVGAMLDEIIFVVDNIMVMWRRLHKELHFVIKVSKRGISLFHRAFQFTIYSGPTNALVCNKTLIQMSPTKTLNITPTCFDHQIIIIRELFVPG